MNWDRSQFGNLLRDERGNTIMTFGLTSMLAIAAVGGAIDFGRSYQLKSKMQNSLDVAVVSGIAKYRETQDWAQAKTHAAAVFQTNFANAVSPTQANPNPTAGLDQPIVSFAQNGAQLTGTATMTANTPFMNLVIGSNLKMAAHSGAVPPSGKQLEVAIMVDVTGSMGWDASAGANPTTCSIVQNPSSKIDYLKCAGEDLLNILLPANGANNSNVRIGIAPFADKVNAGVYAEKVVDPAIASPSGGGSYAPISNLASTKQGAFTGTYSGATPTAATQPAGAQFGATGASVPSGGVNVAGGTFSNNHCIPSVIPGTPGSAGQLKTTSILTRDSGNHYIGATVTVTVPAGGSKPKSVLKSNTENAGTTVTSTGRKFKPVKEYDYDDGVFDKLDTHGANTSSFYVPLITNETGLTRLTRNHGGNNGPVGVQIPRDGTPNASTGMQWIGVRRVGHGGVTGYWKVTTHNGTDWNYSWVTTANEHFIQVYQEVESETVAGSPDVTISGCESAPTPTQQSTSKLITCVTERMNGTSLDYTAAAIASGRYIGPFNHGNTSKSNYSSDGKCFSAGRELPPVIPLTNDRSALIDFFEDATVGGATAGHLGTAWASYILSPDWSSIWPAMSTPTAYNNSGVMKAAILMTDGEYNIQFSTGGVSTNTSAKQALMLCKQMRDNGIKVFTVGFGFGQGVKPTSNVAGMSDADRTAPGTGTAKERAIDTLSKCASDDSSYYFPYDGESLRTVFKQIANKLSSDISGGTARIVN